jgi:nicotinamidase-related amidase
MKMDINEFAATMKKGLFIDPKTTAILLIDVHRGHLDPEVATYPINPSSLKRVIEALKQLVTIGRELSLPIIYVIVENRMIPGIGREGLINPFIKAINSLGMSPSSWGKSGAASHNIQGSVQTEIIPEIAPLSDDRHFVIRTKRRLSCFNGTDLDILLRPLRVNTLLIGGINTNTCVQCAAFDCFNRDIAAVIIEECVDSMYGDELHTFALRNISRCLGWVLTLADLESTLLKKGGG